MKVGATALTVIASFAHSSASVLVIMFKPPLLAQYTAASGRPTSPPCELMLTMRPPRPAAAIVARDRLAHEEGAAQIDRHHLVPVGLGHVEGRAGEAQARIVDENIDAAVRGDDAGDGFVDRGDVAHVQALRVHSEALRLRLGRERRRVSVCAYGRHDDGSGLGEQRRQLTPNSLGRARDDDDATAEIEAPRRGHVG